MTSAEGHAAGQAAAKRLRARFTDWAIHYDEWYEGEGSLFALPTRVEPCRYWRGTDPDELAARMARAEAEVAGRFETCVDLAPAVESAETVYRSLRMTGGPEGRPVAGVAIRSVGVAIDN